MTDKTLTMLATGDLVLDMPDAESYFTRVAPVLRSADVVVGQGEVVFTDRSHPSFTDHPAPPCDPQNAGALHSAGFHVITLGGNHICDSGAAGIEDTKCIVGDGQITRISYLPCLVNKKGQPEILRHDERGQEVFDYMEEITREASLNVRYEWEEDEVVIHAD